MSHNNRGFTLMEMLVVIAIIALISVLAISQYQSGKNATNLQNAAQLLASDIRQAQTSAISGVVNSSCSSTGNGLGYGVNIVDANDYLVFCDDKGDNYYRPTGLGHSQIIRTVALPKGVTFDDSITGYSVFYFVPWGDVTITDKTNGNPTNSVFILKANGKTATVHVYNTGRIE